MEKIKRRIEIPDDGSEAVVIRGSIRVNFNGTGSVIVCMTGGVAISPADNDDAALPPKAAPCVGDKMPDGTIFAGVSPDTGEPMYTTPDDAPLAMPWEEAMRNAAGLHAHGHNDWRLPSKAELSVLFNSRAAIGGFNIGGSYPAGYYWSSSEDSSYSAWNQRFSDGTQGEYGSKFDMLPTRCVRG